MFGGLSRTEEETGGPPEEYKQASGYPLQIITIFSETNLYIYQLYIFNSYLPLYVLKPIYAYINTCVSPVFWNLFKMFPTQDVFVSSKKYMPLNFSRGILYIYQYTVFIHSFCFGSL